MLDWARVQRACGIQPRPYASDDASGVDVGRVLKPLVYLPVSQQQKEPSERDGYSAFEMPYQVYYKHRMYPVRLIVVKSEGKVKRAQKVRQKHMVWIEARL